MVLDHERYVRIILGLQYPPLPQRKREPFQTRLSLSSNLRGRTICHRSPTEEALVLGTSQCGFESLRWYMSKFSHLIEEIEKMTVLELNDFIKQLQERFGIDNLMPMVTPQQEVKVEEKEVDDSVSVILKDAGASKIAVIKAIREIIELGLRESKDIVDKAPIEIKKDINEAEAKEIKQKLEEVGAVVEIK